MLEGRVEGSPPIGGGGGRLRAFSFSVDVSDLAGRYKYLYCLEDAVGVLCKCAWDSYNALSDS